MRTDAAKHTRKDAQLVQTARHSIRGMISGGARGEFASNTSAAGTSVSSSRPLRKISTAASPVLVAGTSSEVGEYGEEPMDSRVCLFPIGAITVTR